MSMMWDSKKMMQTLMQKRKSGGGPMEMGPTKMSPESSSDAEGEPDPRHAAAQDVMMSMDSKSPEKLMQSLANFVDLHLAQPQKENPMEEDED
jgi:hypothetical protein